MAEPYNTSSRLARVLPPDPLHPEALRGEHNASFYAAKKSREGAGALPAEVGVEEAA